MTILEGDIKLLKSAVMADTPDGGGAMTGTPVVDGQSNALFPDTSEMNRALGNVALRKLFGVAHSDNVDTLLGAHAIITDAPDDPLVHCTLVQTKGWADTRATAQDVIERYVVKSSRISPRLMETHYEGSLQLRLVSAASNADFPHGGDAICLAAPDGHEQYVRVTKVAFDVQTFFVAEGNSTVEFTGTVCTCDLAARLDHDFIGPQVSRLAPEGEYTLVYGTTYASGAQFYGIKPLAAPAAPGDLAAVVSSIFTPLVPAATIETPLIDVFPFLARRGLTNTATGPVTLEAATVSVAPGAIITAPSPMRPATVSLNAGGTAFADDGLGNLKQGSLVVGTVDYLAGRIQFLASSPSYGAGSAALTYTPATAASLTLHSSYFPVTLANQGLAYTNVLAPLPAPGSVRLSFMAQGRWYELADNLQGRLVGRDPGYGTGSVNYATGSVSMTLGALPDVGSSLLLDWGEQASAAAVAPANLPAKLGTLIALPAATVLPSLTVQWSRGAVTYHATAVNGVVAGDATGFFGSGGLWLEPDVFPDGPITVSTKVTDTVITPGSMAATMTTENSASRIYQLPGSLPIAKNTFKASVPVTYPQGAAHPENPVPVFDRNGEVWLGYYGNPDSAQANSYADHKGVRVGSINYDTGVLQIDKYVNLNLWLGLDYINTGTWIRRSYWGIGLSMQQVQLGSIDGLPGLLSYAMTPPTTTLVDSVVTQSVQATSWTSRAATYGPAMLSSGAVFRMGADHYTLDAGVLRKGWNIAMGAPVVANAGVFEASGKMTVTALPASGLNAIDWINAVQNASAGLSKGGVFRTASAPLKTGVMQLIAGAKVGTAGDAGALSGDFTGSVDFQRGIVSWACGAFIDPAALSYNAVFLQYLPLSGALLGLETARLPLDGRVPIYRAGDLQVVHNTQSFQLPNPLVKGTAYSLGRTRLAALKALTAGGAAVDTALYTHDLDAGTITFSGTSDLSGLAQPFSVEHRIEDLLLCSVADISGKLSFTRALTHAYPAGTSFVSSVLAIGDVFARVHGALEQETWTGQWSDELIGSAPLANYNETLAPPGITNRGGITERWALIFTSSTAFRIVGESVGVIGTGTINADCAPLNPATGAPYFTLGEMGWGSGWSAGNVYRFNTAACGAPLWVMRTVLQGPATLLDDKFALAFRGDVDRP